MFDQFSTMAQRAVHGLGVALLPYVFQAEPYLRDAQLVLASTQDKRRASGKTTYLVWPEDRAETAALQSFMTWLTGRQ